MNSFQDLKRLSPSSFIWEIQPVSNGNPIPDELKVKVEIYYGLKHALFSNAVEVEPAFEQKPFCANFDFKDFKVRNIINK